MDRDGKTGSTEEEEMGRVEDEFEEAREVRDVEMSSVAMNRYCEEEETAYMEEAFRQAKEALIVGEVPVGCVFVYKGKIIAQGRNTVNETRNATRHAEMNCVDQTLSWCRQRNLNHVSVLRSVSVYVTVEPCGMCADALGQLGVFEVVFGCSNERFGGCGSVVDVPRLYGYSYIVRKGVRKEEAVDLLKEFYKGENPNAPTDKAKRKT